MREKEENPKIKQTEKNMFIWKKNFMNWKKWTNRKTWGTFEKISRNKSLGKKRKEKKKGILKKYSHIFVGRKNGLITLKKNRSSRRRKNTNIEYWAWIRKRGDSDRKKETYIWKCAGYFSACLTFQNLTKRSIFLKSILCHQKTFRHSS